MAVGKGSAGAESSVDMPALHSITLDYYGAILEVQAHAGGRVNMVLG